MATFVLTMESMYIIEGFGGQVSLLGFQLVTHTLSLTFDDFLCASDCTTTIMSQGVCAFSTHCMGCSHTQQDTQKCAHSSYPYSECPWISYISSLPSNIDCGFLLTALNSTHMSTHMVGNSGYLFLSSGLMSSYTCI